MVQNRIGGTAFKERVGCRNEHIRIMIAEGVISPTVSESGFRQFAESDVRLGLRWMRENARQRACA
jgi:hypothetical protein